MRFKWLARILAHSEIAHALADSEGGWLEMIVYSHWLARVLADASIAAIARSFICAHAVEPIVYR